MTAYSTSEAAKQSGISKNTLLRWIAEGQIPDVQRDRRGWRVWSEEDLQKLKRFQEGAFVPPIQRSASSPMVKAEAAKSLARYGRAMAEAGRG